MAPGRRPHAGRAGAAGGRRPRSDDHRPQDRRPGALHLPGGEHGPGIDGRRHAHSHGWVVRGGIGFLELPKIINYDLKKCMISYEKLHKLCYAFNLKTTHRQFFFEILLNQTEIGLYLLFSD